jgi:hypothetical protein
MFTRTKTLAASFLLGAAVLVTPVSSVAAQTAVQDGLVNVAVGDVTILEDVNIGVAAQVIAQVCGVKVGPIAVLATQVDRGGESDVICEAPGGPITLRQN